MEQYIEENLPRIVPTANNDAPLETIIVCSEAPKTIREPGRTSSLKKNATPDVTALRKQQTHAETFEFERKVVRIVFVALCLHSFFV